MTAAMGGAPHSACHDPGAQRRVEAIQLPDLRDQPEKPVDAGASRSDQGPSGGQGPQPATQRGGRRDVAPAYAAASASRGATTS
ncbi:hypothetical protein E6A55_04365 [Cupriavidus necator H16]|uniref:Uncharacterized protein n=1 Tax=Cupriavidus necator (strain ATCC 17699 / DSM 428 / KCTC 22496 / NCIMB 10442 / H16 / Stanier 337) TaxID=381666 RepID=A0AAE5ZEK4_CUPNH|nr:hypothetical protein E6A55_04365 [Cupriavidus necator H16]